MKLKTLKDLPGHIVGLGTKQTCVGINELKQEAVKWIKYLEGINTEKSKFARKEFIKGRIHELKNFCNISEEDLE